MYSDMFERCIPHSTFMEMEELRRVLHKLDDWQIVSRVALITRDIIDKSPCNGIDIAKTYLPSLLDEIGIDRFRPYRAYLQGTRHDVLEVLREIFPYLQQIHRPLPVDVVKRNDLRESAIFRRVEGVRYTRPRSNIRSTIGPWIPIILILIAGVIVSLNQPWLFTPKVPWFTPKVKIGELVLNPEKYVNTKIEVEGVLSSVLFKPLYCPGGTLKGEINLIDSYMLVDELLEYSIVITKPPDDGKRVYHIMEIGRPFYIYRFRGEWRKFKVSCCVFSISNGRTVCTDSYIYALLVTEPGEVIKVIE